MTPYKVVLVGIAGTQEDFLLAPYVLRSYVEHDISLKDRVEIIVKSSELVRAQEIRKRSREIAEDIESERAHMVGFSCYMWNMGAVESIIDHLRKLDSRAEIVLGGPEIDKKDILQGRFEGLAPDYLVYGEGERPFISLLKWLFIRDKRVSRGQIKGLAYRENGSYVCHDEPDVIGDLPNAPSPFLSDQVPQDILTREGIRANVETQRGCNFRCAYCFYHKNFRKIRYRSPDVVIHELAYLYAKGVRTGRILDANFLSNKRHARAILQGLIDRSIPFNLMFEVHPRSVDEEMASLLGEYRRNPPGNKIMIGIGIQTTNQEALAVIRRKIPVRYFERAFDLLQKQDLVIKSDVILGLPRESKETYFQTLEFVGEKMRNGMNILSLSLLHILPGSEMAEIADLEGLVLDKKDGTHSVYSSPSLPRPDMLECLRLNVTAHRVLSTNDFDSQFVIRDLFFKVKDSIETSCVDLLGRLSREFSAYLEGTDANYVKPDFPAPEEYQQRRVFTDIPDDWLMYTLRKM